MTHKFWNQSGLSLLEVNERGMLQITPDYLRAFLSRPELAPENGSCVGEIALHADLVKDPFLSVPEELIDGLRDADTAENYKIFLRFRDDLVKAETIENAYLTMMRSNRVAHPSLLINELVPLILHHCLRDCVDALMVRAAELFFRPQKLTQEEGQILLADQQVLGIYEKGLDAGQLGRMLKQMNAPPQENQSRCAGQRQWRNLFFSQ